MPERILIFVDVHDLISAEIDGVRTESPRAIEVVGIKNLVGDGLPSSG